MCPHKCCWCWLQGPHCLEAKLSSFLFNHHLLLCHLQQRLIPFFGFFYLFFYLSKLYYYRRKTRQGWFMNIISFSCIFCIVILWLFTHQNKYCKQAKQVSNGVSECQTKRIDYMTINVKGNNFCTRYISKCHLTLT
jgi:hypothetical protein